MSPLLPGDRLWNRYRVDGIERAIFHGAWLLPLNSSAPVPLRKALLELHLAHSQPLAALLSHLAPGKTLPAPVKTKKKKYEAPLPPEAVLPLLGEVEWYGSPGSGQVAVVPAPAAMALATWRGKHGALNAAQALPLLIRLARDLHALLSRSHDARRKKVSGELLRALASCLTPAGVGLQQHAAALTLLPFAGETNAARIPPAWAEALAPEYFLDASPPVSALGFGVARLAAYLVGAWKQPLPRNELAWGALALWTTGKRDPAREFAEQSSGLKLPESFAETLLRALHRKPARRFASLEKFADALDALRAEAWARAVQTCSRCAFVLQPALATRKDCPVCGTPVPALPQSASGASTRPSSPGTTRLRRSSTGTPAAAASEATATMDAALSDGLCVIEAGPYLSGDDLTPRTLRAFAIDRFPVTEGDYKNFLIATNREPRPGGPGGRPGSMDALPVTNITWHEAVEYAEAQGKRLPTVYEWEKAARGVDGRKFPFGNQFKPGLVKLRSNDNPDGAPEPHPVGKHPRSASPYGVQDLVGNVLQWTTTARRAGERIYRAVKGSCAADSAPDLMRCSGIQFLPPDTMDGMVGFRCVKDLE